jgi:hypothetical protein
MRKTALGVAALAAVLGGVVSAAPASASNNGFVWFSNKAVTFPTVCITEFDSSATQIYKKCTTMTSRKLGHAFSTNAYSATMSVNNGLQVNYQFTLTVGTGNCIRESGSGSVHWATDKPCTWG